MSIRTRVFLGLLLTGLVPVLVLILATYTVLESVNLQAETKGLSDINRVLSDNIGVTMEKAATDLDSIVTNPLLDGKKPALIKAEIERLVKVYDQFADITYYDLKGYMIESTQSRLEGGIDHREFSQEFQNAAQGKITISSPQAKLGMPGLYLMAYFPVKGNGSEVTGVVKARLSFEKVMSTLNAAAVGRDGYALLLDRFGNAISRHDGLPLLEKLDPNRRVSIWGEKPNGVYRMPDGRDYLYVASLLAPEVTRTGGPWTLIALKPISEVQAVLAESRRVLVLALLTMLALATTAAYFVARRIVRPVVRAAEVADRVAHDDLEVSIEDDGPRELRRLAKSFNGMISEVRDHRFRLEQLVAERTEKLVTSERELRETYAELRAAYEATREAILVVHRDGSVITCNKNFSDWFDLPQSVIGDPFENVANDFASRMVRPREFAAKWRELNRGMASTETVEWQVANPQERELEFYGAPVYGAEGVFARIWVFRDLTQRKLLQRGLQQAQKMEAVGRLAGGVAHDFNNLLTGIIGNLEMVEMEKSSDPDEVYRLVGAARQAGKRATELVKQLLGFSRHGKLQLEHFNVNDLAKEVKELVGRTIDPRIQIATELDPNVWGVTADPNQIQQVLMNMVVNARDALGENPGRITISTANEVVDALPDPSIANAPPGDYIRISVHDNGSGIPPEVKAKMFEPFFTTKEPGKGTGLGLATCYGIIHQHHGWISCDSEVGRGTTFQIYLPRGKEPAKKEKAPTETTRVKAGGGETILIVDDEQVVRMVGERMLKHHGFKVLTACDGEDALEVLAKHGNEIDLMILDLTMPKLSGKATFQRMRQGPFPYVPVVICSGYAVDLDKITQEFGSRVEGCVQKPYDAAVLVSVLRSVLDSRQAALPA